MREFLDRLLDLLTRRARPDFLADGEPGAFDRGCRPRAYRRSPRAGGSVCRGDAGERTPQGACRKGKRSRDARGGSAPRRPRGPCRRGGRDDCRDGDRDRTPRNAPRSGSPPKWRWPAARSTRSGGVSPSSIAAAGSPGSAAPLTEHHAHLSQRPRQLRRGGGRAGARWSPTTTTRAPCATKWRRPRNF